MIAGVLRYLRVQRQDPHFLYIHPLIYEAMKRLLISIVSVLCLVSCVSLSERVDAFVSDIEANYATYDEADWLQKDQKMAEFKLEYAEKSPKLSDLERDSINKAFGRYDAVVAKSKVDGVVNGVKEFLQDAGRYIEGIVEGIGKSDSQEMSM